MISVIVPVYKVEPYLHQCIDSILGQTYRDLEVLLIDDGSPDRCGGICDGYARIDPRVKVFHTENKGLSAARNLGLREAKGEYVGFVDSDDWIEPDMYEILLRRIEETGTSISVCGVRRESQKKQKDYSMNDHVFIGTDAIRALICRLSTCVWNKLYRKTCWESICFPVNHTYEDISTIYRIVLNSNSLSCVPKPLYHYRTREGSIIHTHTMNNLMDYWYSVYDRYSFLMANPEFSEDHEISDYLEMDLASASVNTWKWVFLVSREQRDYVFLHRVSDFVRKHYPLSGKKNWSLSLRTGIFFSRYPNEASFAIMYALNRIYIFSKSITVKLFPS